MSYYQLEIVVFAISSFTSGLLVGILLSSLFQDREKPSTKRKPSSKCPWCGKFKREGKICKCEE